MISKKVQTYIEDHSFCSEYLFKDWESFLDLLYAELAAIPETVPEMTADKSARTFGSSARQTDGKESEKTSVLQDLTAKKADPKKPGHGRKKPARTEETR